MKVYIFFNGDEVGLPNPQSDVWTNYTGHDTARLALLAGESWRQQGWQVEYYRATFKPKFIDELKDSPYPFWGNLYEMAKIGPAMFSTIDVFNRSFKPLFYLPESLAVSYCRDTFSMATIWATPQWCQSMIELIRRYDEGCYPRLPIQMVSDESIIRAYGRAHITQHVMNYGLIEDQDQPLVHYPRSILQHWQQLKRL